MRISIKADTSRLAQDLAAQQARLRRVARRVANYAAISAGNAVVDEMKRVLDKPTPYVLNGLRVELATEANLAATLDWKVASGNNSSGPGAARVLRAQIEGGPRRLKRFEKALGLPADRIAVPGKWAELDAYGNIKGGQITKILSALRLLGEVGYLANARNRRSRGVRRAEQYFIIRPGTDRATLSPGIYRTATELGGAPLLVIAFVRAATYRRRFDPVGRAHTHVTRNIRDWWDQGLRGTLPSVSARITGA